MNEISTSIPKIESNLLMNRLRQETKATHAKLESLPYFMTLTEHLLPLECYVNQLRALSVIHGVLENELTAVSNINPLSSVWNDELRKLPLLEADLNFFRFRCIPDAEMPIQQALSMTERIRIRRIANPMTLIGYLYVLEGSILGNSLHRPDISATYHLSELEGCRYYSSYGKAVQYRWQQFTRTVNDAFVDPLLHDPIIQSAQEAFSGLESLYRSLYPLKKSDRTYHVARINPEAGNHPIPEDEREIQAAIEVSNQLWKYFPYFEHRYGHRGKRFSDSDICWLVTLAPLSRQVLQRQIDWLCRVLATRGMPTIMMEYTLRYLFRELKIAVPDKALEYQSLDVTADMMKSVREQYVSETVMQLLSDEFDTSVGIEMSVTYSHTGNLLVSAVVDEKKGIEGALFALLEWLTDSKRFSRDWISAVNATIKKVQCHLG